ncbi:MAG TPA: aminotransferase class I/II-fold pyridoxal phosphate-dependent enzyme [Thermoplasmata archaeon]|nr:aminotransferase class I/II-fold pyridoxal phosphate-dependent enzyme [Thermoplasmata archaeon]
MVAQRVRQVEISGIRKMFEAAPPNAINLGLGEPDFDPPPEVVRALCAAVQNGQNHYGPSAGLPSLREKIAERYHDRDPDTSRDNVIITAGGSEALMTVALTLYEQGDEVLVPNPGFVLYAPHARLCGATPVPYDLDESRGYVPDLDALESHITPRTRAIVVNSPSNPTGCLFPKSTVEHLLEFAEAHDLHVISDEVYEEMIYEGRFTSFWGRSDRVIVVNSFSKTFAMTGWRLGFVVAPRSLTPDINKVHYHLMACPSTPVQAAVLAGLNEAPNAAARMMGEFRARRRLIVHALNRIDGIHCVPPSGAFYVFPRFDWESTASEVAGDLLQRGLITTPGDAFGSLGAGHLRLSFAASQGALRRGMGILRAYAKEVGAR